MEQAVTNYRRSSVSSRSGEPPPYPLAVTIGTDPGLFSPAKSQQLRAIKPASQRVPDQHNMLTSGGLMIPVFSATPPPPGCYACRGLPLNARGGGRSAGELGRVFAERKERTDLCHREAVEECRRYTELALQHQQAAVDQQQQQQAASRQRLAGYYWS